jgi:DinB superfamily
MREAALVSAPEPTLEDLRRARGEGWQWPRIAREACPQCGLNAAALPRASLGLELLDSVAAWHEFLGSADDTFLRTNPEPGVFSPLQYGAHVRDIVRVYGDRIVLARDEDNPTFPQFNPSSAVFEGYNALDVEDLARDLSEQARRLAAMLDDLREVEWDRTLTRDGGSDGVFTFTVHGLACYALHESHHHLLDARGELHAS